MGVLRDDTTGSAATSGEDVLDPWAEQLAFRMRARFRQQPSETVVALHLAELRSLQDELPSRTIGGLRSAVFAAVAGLLVVAALGASLVALDRETRIASTGPGTGDDRSGQATVASAEHEAAVGGRAATAPRSGTTEPDGGGRDGDRAIGDATDRRDPSGTTPTSERSPDPASPTTGPGATTAPAATSATTKPEGSGRSSSTISSTSPLTKPSTTTSSPSTTSPRRTAPPTTTTKPAPTTTAPTTTTTTPPGGATCAGRPATIVGTENDDVLFGTEGPDVIVGLGGNDRIEGLGGNDTICGGNGKDELYGDSGDDAIYGGNGKDLLVGGTGADFLDGGNGPDTEIQENV